MPIINISKLENNTKFIADICIIGAGMSGQIVASKIKNKKVKLNDSGGVDFNSSIQKLNDIDNIGLKLRANKLNRVRQLGGSANLWANQLMILNANEIGKREWLDKNLEWPLEYDELKNYEEMRTKYSTKVLEILILLIFIKLRNIIQN